MNEDDFMAATKAKAEQLHREVLEDSLVLSYGDKIRKITAIFREVLELIEKTIEYAPSFVLLEYNRDYRARLEAAKVSEDFQLQISLVAELIDGLVEEDERIEVALREGDGDLNSFVTYFAQAGIFSSMAHGVAEALLLEEEFEDLEDE